jgi:hypothetical protein
MFHFADGVAFNPQSEMPNISYGPGTNILSAADMSTPFCSVRIRKLRSSPLGFFDRGVA